MKNNLNQIGIKPETVQTTAPVVAGATAGVAPEFIRLPKSGTLCPHTGLSRSKMNELVLPSEQNNFKPAVTSISLRNRGQIKAVRLISYDSLMAYLHSFLQDGGTLIAIILFAALAAPALGHTLILGDSLQAQPAHGADCNLPLGNTLTGQITNQSAHFAGPGNVNAAARDLACMVPAMAMA